MFPFAIFYLFIDSCQEKKEKPPYQRDNKAALLSRDSLLDGGKEIYKPVPKDQIDERLAEYLRRHRCATTFKRLEKGYYSFGSMKLQATIQKSRLMFNVNHTFIPVEELVKNYSDQDSSKKQKKDSSPLYKSTLTSSTDGITLI